MPALPVHRVIAADHYLVPPPFRAFAVRSDEPVHAFDARAPYGRVHHVHTEGLEAGSLAALAAEGYARVRIEDFADIDYAVTTLQELSALAPRVPDLVGCIAGALRATGVLGDDVASYRSTVATRIATGGRSVVATR